MGRVGPTWSCSVPVRSCTRRWTRPMYTGRHVRPMYTGRTGPTTQWCTWPVHDRIHGRVRVHVYKARTHRICRVDDDAHSPYTAVYTTVYTALYTVHTGSVHGCVRAVYTACTWWCTRVHSPYTAVNTACTGRVHHVC